MRVLGGGSLQELYMQRITSNKYCGPKGGGPPAAARHYKNGRPPGQTPEFWPEIAPVRLLLRDKALKLDALTASTIPLFVDWVKKVSYEPTGIASTGTLQKERLWYHRVSRSVRASLLANSGLRR